jgi:hypothetical protein
VVLAVVCGTLFAFASQAGAVPVPWRNCGSATDKIQVTELDASVWPPVAGQSIILSYRANVLETITAGATDTIGVTLPSGKQIGPRTIPFVPPPPYTALPIPAGPISSPTGGLSFVVPHKLKAGVYAIHLVATNGDGSQLLCADLSVPIKRATKP